MANNKYDFTLTETIRASQERVYQVLADMEAYPEFIKDLISVKRDGDLYRFVARASILTITATLAVHQVPNRLITFELVEGPVEQLSGSWEVEAGETPEQTKVTFTVQAGANKLGQWLLRMTAKFVERKSDRMVGVFHDRVMALDRRREASPPSPPVQQKGGQTQDQAAPVAPTPVPVRPASTLFMDESQLQTLEALAATLLPPDEFDAGVQEMGLAGVVETRARYEASRVELYLVALAAVDGMAQAMFNRSRFVDLAKEERKRVMETIRQNQANGTFWGQIKPATFFSALWEDVVFLYCTHPETWERIGFPGPSFEQGGHPDFDQKQSFLGK